MNLFVKRPLIKTMSVILAVLMLATGCSNAGNTVVAKVGEVDITYKQFEDELQRMLNQYGLEDTPENAESINYLKESVLDMLVDKEVYRQMMIEKKIEATQEEKDSAKAAATDWQEQNLQYLISNYTAQGEAEPEKKAKQFLDKYMTDNRIDTEFLESNFLFETMFNKFYDETTKDAEVSQDELKKEYDNKIDTAKKAYAEDMSQYELDQQSGTPIYYNPAGVYYVKHILLGVSEEERANISKLRTESKDDEADKARDAALEKIKGKSEDALKRVKAGEDFDKLIKELGEDPGMTTPPTMDTGYVMYEGCKTYVKQFTEGSLALKKDGDVSGLVGTDYGYHIIKRVSTLKEGAVPFENVSENLKKEMLAAQKNKIFDAEIENWKSNNTIETFKEKVIK